MSTTLRLVLFLMLPMAAYPADVHVPDELQDWEAWVLQDKEYRQCPFYFNRSATERNEFVCAWPGMLSITVDAERGSFDQTWTVYAEDAWIPLPGDAAYWPDRVTANGSNATVVERNGIPSVRLAPGTWRLSGRFEWDDRPGVLRVPRMVGLVDLTVNGQRIARPELNSNGVFLGERQQEAQARDAVEVQVYRLVRDDVPTRLATTLQIDVSGSVREELFGPVLPGGFVPLAISSELPARLEADGQLRVQVRPGRWTVSLFARAPDVLNSLTLPDSDSSFPGSEIWSYQSNDALRVTAAEGLPPVDPQRVGVPGEWQNLPAYRINKGESFEITERSRGIVSADNDLSIARQMWLDFAGGGFVVRDQLSGTMRRDWRLDMLQPFELGSASENGENLLITNGENDGNTGIELRQSDVDVVAIGRTDTRGALPVTGWDTRFNNVSTTIYLPPGNKLLTAPGADNAPGSWLGQWELLDYFMVLIITIAAWKLFGRNAGVIAFLALALSYHEINAPAWLWLNVLIAIALLRVAPLGRLRTSVRGYLALSVIFLVFALVPFIASQLRVAIYPQLEPQYQTGRSGGFILPAVVARSPVGQTDSLVMDLQGSDMEARRNQERELAYSRPVEALEEVTVTGSRPESRNFARYAPNAIVQAGPGIPSWQWNRYYLTWSGPVDASQDLRLVILPRWAVTLARFFEVVMLLLFAATVAAEILRKRWTLPGGLKLGQNAAGIVAAGFLGIGMLASPPAEAQTPSPEILRELESRLLQAPDCVPRCAEILSADVDVGADAVRMTLTVNAAEEVAIPLPGAVEGWRPNAISIDGSAAQVMRFGNQQLWLRVTPGRHNVVLTGSTANVDSVEIPFPTPPRVIRADGEGWFIAGIKDRRLLSGSLQLTRLQSEDGGDGTPRWESSRFPPFVTVHRTIEFGLDWRMTTTVERVAPQQGALTLELPLVPGETVVTDDMTAENGTILVSMNPRQNNVTWQSNLPRTSPLVLDAIAGMPWTEIWYARVGTVWHAEFSGVPESQSQTSGNTVRMAVFNPRGGESLTIDASRPEAAEGSTLAFDAVSMRISQGARSRSTELSLSYRSTRGAQHVVQLPAEADVSRVVIDGTVEPLRAEAGQLTLPILPGEHRVVIEWREDGDVGTLATTPDVDIGAPASNITLGMSVPANRWLLATNGPKLGPAVLYWSELVVLIIFALIFGRIEWTPLRTHHWLLLGLGFSTFNWTVLGFVAAWLLVVGAREKSRGEMPWWRYNLWQTGVVLLTVLSLASIVGSLPFGLLGTPDMHVVGNGSFGNSLTWFADRSESLLPSAGAVTAPMWIYKVLILGWALWLSFALLRWLPWVWACFAKDGFFRSRKYDAMEAAANEV